ncbi:MAG: type II secretion system F family protein [Kiritimatiellaeota bacterium]|nr:type II secretion system F family protein [Kiritimatiellota bacterium]
MGPDWSINGLSLLWALSLAGVAWYAGRVAVQITYITLADGRRQERRLPLLFRLMLPMAPNLTPVFERPFFAKTCRELDRRIIMAGFEGLLTGVEFLALRVMVPLLLGTVLCAAFGLTIAYLPARLATFFHARQAMFFFGFFALAFAWPGLWLQGSIRARHRQIEFALPFVLDLLTLSVEAGLDFMTAIKRIIDRRAVDAFGEELIRAFREVQLGSTRRDALRAMAERVGQTDVLSVVHALVQADELGVSIGSMLRIQAEQIRTRRFQRAEKLANEAPVKMLFPLVAFIFPSVFIILLGPILLQWMENGF